MKWEIVNFLVLVKFNNAEEITVRGTHERDLYQNGDCHDQHIIIIA